MNREKVKKLLPIYHAFAEGKTIQCYHHAEYPEWTDLPDFDGLIFPAKGYDYRIKPEPKVIYVNEYIGQSNGHLTEDAARSAAACGQAKRIAVKYVEAE